MSAPSETPEQLAYRKACSQLPSPAPQAETDLLWLRFLIDSFKKWKDPRIFDALSWKPRADGLVAARRYAFGEIGVAAFLDATQSEFGDSYLDLLVRSGIISAVPWDQYRELEAELQLETLKAYTAVRDSNPTRDDSCGDIGRAASVMFFRYMDSVHGLLGLPPVSAMADGWTTWSEPEAEVLASGKFSEYAIRDQTERDHYSDLRSGKSGA